MNIYLDTAIKQIKKGLVSQETINQNLAKHFELEHKARFLADMKVEYDLKFPTHREMTDEEKANYELEEVESYPLVKIDYSQDESYMTFEEYRDETKVIQEAVEDVYDDEGILISKGQEEIRELVRPFIPKDNYDTEIEDFLTNCDEYKIYLEKQKEKKLDNIIVQVDDIRFYSDPISRADISDAIKIAELESLPDTETKNWKTADGEKQVTLLQLKKALRPALEEKAKIIGVINE